jgi:hypothetical protein
MPEFEGTVSGIDVITMPSPRVRCLAFVSHGVSDEIQVTTNVHELQTALELASATKVRVEVSYVEDPSEKRLVRVRLLDRPGSQKFDDDSMRRQEMAIETKGSPSEALRARGASACSVEKRTRSLQIVNESAWAIEIAFQQVIQEHDLPPQAGYIANTGVYTACQNTPPHTNCVTDPCLKVGQPIQGTRAKCSAKFVYNGNEKDINFPDITTPEGKYIVDCGWRVHSVLDEIVIEQRLVVRDR